MFDKLGQLLFHRRRWVLALTGVFVTGALVWGTGVFGSLANGGFDDPNSEAVRALDKVEAGVGRDGADVIVLYRSDTATVDSPAYRDAVGAALAKLPKDKVLRTNTFWSTRSPALVSQDKHSTYAALTLAGGTDDERLETFHQIEDTLRQPVDGLTVRLGGGAAIFDEVNEQTEADVQRAEMISLPLVLVLLVLIFGGLVAASLTPAGRRAGDPRRVHRAAGHRRADRRVDLLDQHRHDDRARPVDRLRAVRRHPVPGGTRRRPRRRGSAAPDDEHRRPNGGGVRADGRDRDPEPAAVPGDVPAFDRTAARPWSQVAMIAALTALPATLAVLGHRVEQTQGPVAVSGQRPPR